MNKRYDVMAPRPKKDGGTFWVRVGTAFDGDRGIGIEFDALPIPDKDGRVSVRLFEPRERTGNGPNNPGSGGVAARGGGQSYGAADLDEPPF